MVELNVTDQTNASSCKIIKNSAGTHWELKLYQQKNQTMDKVVQELERLNNTLKIKFGNNQRK